MTSAHRQDTSGADCPELFRLLHSQQQWGSAADRKRAYHLLWQKLNPDRVNAICRTHYNKHGYIKQQKHLICRLNRGAACKPATLAKYQIKYDPLTSCWTAE